MLSPLLWRGVGGEAFAQLTSNKSVQSVAKFDKPTFYNIMKFDDTLKINKELIILKSVPIKEKEVYEGALLMKKAGIMSNLKTKLKEFKIGRTKLEEAILKDSTNTEYHFLRLMIQEHAPKILNYNADIEKDNIYIRKNFKKVCKELKEIMMDYSKQSKSLLNIDKV